jgi:uracil phosphoribosyltransferase
MSCPPLDDRIVIVSDPMLATGASIVKTIQFMKNENAPRAIHVVVAIACTVGIEFIHRECGQDIKVWCGDIDDELTAKGYIVPGLGDAGDLAFGTKMQA